MFCITFITVSKKSCKRVAAKIATAHLGGEIETIKNEFTNNKMRSHLEVLVAYCKANELILVIESVENMNSKSM